MVSISPYMGLLKLMLISSGVVSIIIFCKVYVGPFILDLSNVSQFLLLWNSIHNFLKPLYLFIVINLIIITIAASSRFNNTMINTCQDANYSPDSATPAPICLPKLEGSDGFEEKHVVVVESGSKSSAGGGSSVEFEYDGDREESDFVVLRSKRRAKGRVDCPVSSPEIILPAENPFLPSVRERLIDNGGFRGAGTRPLTRKSSLKRQYETLEDTWKAITNGRGIVEPSNTWQDGDDRRMILLAPPQPPVEKSETSENRSTPSPVKPRKEMSWSQDELNERVEMFIRKTNEEMRLQRLESLEQFHEMINRGL